MLWMRRAVHREARDSVLAGGTYDQGVSRQVAVRFDGRTVRSASGESLEQPESRVA